MTGFTPGQQHEQHGEDPPHSSPEARQAHEQVICVVHLPSHRAHQVCPVHLPPPGDHCGWPSPPNHQPLWASTARPFTDILCEYAIQLNPSIVAMQPSLVSKVLHIVKYGHLSIIAACFLLPWVTIMDRFHRTLYCMFVPLYSINLCSYLTETNPDGSNTERLFREISCKTCFILMIFLCYCVYHLHTWYYWCIYVL